MACVERGCDFGHSEGNALMPLLSLNNGVYRQKANGIGKI
jgi:hypothetical protein